MKGLFIAFIVVQIGLDLAHSVTAFPFVHYGMFSAAPHVPDSLPVFQITVNGRRLVQTDYRIYRWDMIEGPLTAFDRLKGTHDFAFDRQKLEEYLRHYRGGALYRLMQPHLENAPDIAERFPGWYRNYLGNLLGYAVNTLRVDKAWYTWREGQLQLLGLENYFTL